jgi:ubiquinone/menaquinone biosynthesis C-methylase UbiE
VFARDLPSWRADFVKDLTSRCNIQGKKVLEIGAGDCMVAESLGNDYGPSVHFATDLSLPRHTDRRIVPVEMSASELRFPSNYFDVVYSHNVFEHIHDLSGAWNEVVRVLKPGGRIFVHFAPIWTHSFGHHCYEETEQQVQSAIPPYGHLYLSRQELEQLLKQSTRVFSQSRWNMRQYLLLDGCNKLWPQDYRSILLTNRLLNYLEVQELRGHHHDRPVPAQVLSNYPNVPREEFEIVGWQIFAEKAEPTLDETDQNFYDFYKNNGLPARSVLKKIKGRLVRLRESV